MMREVAALTPLCDALGELELAAAPRLPGRLLPGRVAERTKATVLKTVDGASRSRVEPLSSRRVLRRLITSTSPV